MIHFFTGKGGVGKTHVATQFKSRIGANGFSYERAPALKNPGFTYLDPEKCLREYLTLKFKFKKAVDLVLNTKVIANLFQAAPGVDAIATTGKIFDMAKTKDVVVDAPSSGHFIPWISTAKAFCKVIPFGPVHDDASQMVDVFYSQKTTQVHVVSLPQDIVLEETVELIENLKKEGLPLGKIFMNKVLSKKFNQQTPGSLEELFNKKMETQQQLLKNFPLKYDVVEWEL